MTLLDTYSPICGPDVIHQMQQLAIPLKGAKVVHINSTKSGGGVAEILSKLIPLTRELGIDAHWEVITGNQNFFECTKAFHNALQGTRIPLGPGLVKVYEDVNAENAEKLTSLLKEADFVFVHDPQPAPLIQYIPDRRGKWIWRCHIDVSHPYRPVWKYLKQFVTNYNASIFSLAAFAQDIPHPQYIIPPSIDPLSDKNRDLDSQIIANCYGTHNLDPNRPLVIQISRFDHFKDPIGVIRAYQLAKQFLPGLQLVLAGGGAVDDPEGESVLREVELVGRDDEDIHILPLPPDSNLDINALQRAADIVIQKSIREGFGLTVTEALWKGKPVIGGDVGGIRLQVINHHTGFLVNTPEGAALRIRYLLHQPGKIMTMGEKGHHLVRNNFLITRHLRDYLTLMVALLHGAEDRIQLV